MSCRCGRSLEPPSLWSSRLPARSRAVGPRVERLPAGELALAGARYVERPGTDGPLVDYWVYEDLHQSLKRAVTASGRDRDDMTMTATTYDDVRPGSYDPVARLPLWDPALAATGTVLCLHIGSGTKMPMTSPDAPLGVTVTIGSATA